MPKVSVIVPCLNMQKYIEECLESIIGQTLADLEILVVDAGSTDGTLDSIDKKRESDRRIHLIQSEKKSYGYQVNLGIEQAAGDYIAIVDADDRISPNMYEDLYNVAICSGADYVKGTAGMFYTLSDEYIYYRPLGQFEKKEYSEGRLELCPMNRPDLLMKDNFLWYGIFKKELLSDVRLHESPGAAFQDLGGLLQTQMKAKHAVYLDRPFYEYRQDNVNASTNNPRGFEFIWNEYIWAEKFVVNASGEWKAAFYKKLFLHTLDRYYAMGESAKFWEGAEFYIDKIRKKLKSALSGQMLSVDSFTAYEKENLELLLGDAYSLYHIYAAPYREARKQMSDLAAIVKDKKTIIFGCGKLGTFLHAWLLKQKWCDVVAYCDNSAENQGKQIWDVPVLQPLEAVSLYAEDYFIVANKKYARQMKEQLIDSGVWESHICCYTAGADIRLVGESLT